MENPKDRKFRLVTSILDDHGKKLVTSESSFSFGLNKKDESLTKILDFYH